LESGPSCSRTRQPCCQNRVLAPGTGSGTPPIGAVGCRQDQCSVGQNR
jgi:hypothetical protein